MRSWRSTNGLRGWAIALCCSVLLGCLDHDGAPDDTGRSTTFIAQDSDFHEFRSWMDFTVSESDTHAAATGKVVVYINRLPSSSDTAFPVGTLIVKTVETGKPSEWTIHAMAKRGEDFNLRGALGWEFFALMINEDDIPVLVWRGAKPPNGESYQSLPGDDAMDTEADCIDCHVSSHNDAVLDDMLDLKALR